MAVSLGILGKNLVSSKLFSYGKKLKVATKTFASFNNKNCVRAFSSSGISNNNSSRKKKFIRDSKSGWPDELLGPVAPANQKFPLPGNFC